MPEAVLQPGLLRRDTGRPLGRAPGCWCSSGARWGQGAGFPSVLGAVPRRVPIPLGMRHKGPKSHGPRGHLGQHPHRSQPRQPRLPTLPFTPPPALPQGRWAGCKEGVPALALGLLPLIAAASRVEGGATSCAAAGLSAWWRGLRERTCGKGLCRAHRKYSVNAKEYPSTSIVVEAFKNASWSTSSKWYPQTGF